MDEIPTAETYEAISQPAGDLVVNGRVAKFLIDWRDRQQPRVHFVNGNFVEDGQTPGLRAYHYFFARAALNIPESLGEFNEVTYFTQDKRYVAGRGAHLPAGRSAEPVYGLQFYPQDVIAEETVVDGRQPGQGADHRSRRALRVRADRVPADHRDASTDGTGPRPASRC